MKTYHGTHIHTMAEKERAKQTDWDTHRDRGRERERGREERRDRKERERESFSKVAIRAATIPDKGSLVRKLGLAKQAPKGRRLRLAADPRRIVEKVAHIVRLLQLLLDHGIELGAVCRREHMPLARIVVALTETAELERTTTHGMSIAGGARGCVLRHAWFRWCVYAPCHSLGKCRVTTDRNNH